MRPAHHTKRWLICAKCGNGFSAVKIDAMYCTKRCTKAASRQRLKDQRAAIAAAKKRKPVKGKR